MNKDFKTHAENVVFPQNPRRADARISAAFVTALLQAFAWCGGGSRVFIAAEWLRQTFFLLGVKRSINLKEKKWRRRRKEGKWRVKQEALVSQTPRDLNPYYNHGQIYISIYMYSLNNEHAWRWTHSGKMETWQWPNGHAAGGGDSRRRVKTHILCRWFLACPTCRWRDTWRWAYGAAGSRRRTGSEPPSGCRSGSASDQSGRRCPRPAGLHTALEGRRRRGGTRHEGRTLTVSWRRSRLLHSSVIYSRGLKEFSDCSRTVALWSLSLPA